MKNKTTFEVIQDLKELGYVVNYRKRTDGGYIITAINGKKYKAARGNQVARRIVNAPISQYRSSQLKSIKMKHKKTTKTKAKYTALDSDDELMKLHRKAQRYWRKTNKYKIEGSRITKKNLIWNLENLGREATIKKLENIIRYAKGFANEENIRWLKIRIRQELGNYGVAINSQIDSISDRFKDEWIDVINQMIYNRTKSRKEKAREVMNFLLSH